MARKRSWFYYISTAMSKYKQIKLDKKPVSLRPRRNFFVFLVCLSLSALFWYIIALNEEREIDFNLKLNLKNVPENVVVTNALPPNIKVTLKDRGAQLLSYKYSGGLPTVNIDFRNYDQQSGHVILKNNDITKTLLAKLQATTKVTAINPSTIDYYYNFGLHSKVPVKLRASISTNKFYNISSVKLYPDSVTVYSSKSILDTLSTIYTDYVTLSQLKEKTIRRIPLSKIKGAKIVPETTVLRVDIDQITEKTVNVPIKHINFPATKDLKTFPSSVQVTFQIGTAMYKQVNADDFVIAISYEDVLKNTNGKLHLSLKSVPAGVSRVRIVPEYVDYLIEDVTEEE